MCRYCAANGFATQSRAGNIEDVQAIRIRLATVIESPK
jgi:hypothetical protein